MAKIIPLGLCQCGCGGKTNISPINRYDRGIRQGFPVNYIQGHNRSGKSLIKYLIDQSTGCWLWQSTLTNDGYGVFELYTIRYYAHRYFYEQKFGEIPKEKVIDHICNRHCCVNPDHMQLSTFRENIKRGYDEWAEKAKHW